MNLKAVAVSALSCATLAACGTKAGNEAEKAGVKAQLATGDYSLCTASAVPDTKSRKETFYITEARISRSYKYYNLPDCKSDDEVFEVTYTGKSKIGDATAGKDESAGSFWIDMNFDRVKAKVTTDGAVKWANGLHTCGKTDWAKDQEFDVTDTKSLDPACALLAPAPESVYVIAKVGGGDLRLGKATVTENKKNDKARPTHLDSEKVYKKGI